MNTESPATISAPHDGTGHVETNPTDGHTPGPWSWHEDRFAGGFSGLFGPSMEEVIVPSSMNDGDTGYAWFDEEVVTDANRALIARAPEMAAEIERLKSENAGLREDIKDLREDLKTAARDDRWRCQQDFEEKTRLRADKAKLIEMTTLTLTGAQALMESVASNTSDLSNAETASLWNATGELIEGTLAALAALTAAKEG